MKLLNLKKNYKKQVIPWKRKLMKRSLRSKQNENQRIITKWWRSGMKNNYKKLGIVFIFFLLMSCTTEKIIFVELPEFAPYRPEKPPLYPMSDDTELPIVVLKNTALLQGYALELEVYADGWEKFYSELRKQHAETKRNKRNYK